MLPDSQWKFRDPSSRLGLPRGASIDFAKKHYRKLALLYHPVKFKKLDTVKRFHAIKDAYDTLVQGGM